MTPANVQLPNIVQGDTWEGFTVPEVKSCGQPMLNTLARVRLQFKRADAAAVGAAAIAALDLDTDSSTQISILDPVNWAIQIGPVDYSDMEAVTAGEWKWDLETTDSAGIRLTIYQGTITVLADTTQ
ncbi:MAG: hypothetical protein AAF226_08670 [Verrucomicrobiota bacterium]